MDKSDIARTLRDMAVLIELAAGSHWEIMAYQNGADQLEEWSGDLQQAVRDETLTDIPGIGKGLAKVIGQLVREGRSDTRDALLSQFPPDLPDVLLVPGLGPKKVKALHDELGIGSLEDLEAAARQERIRTLKGFGARTEETILSKLDVARKRKARRDSGRPS